MQQRETKREGESESNRLTHRNTAVQTPAHSPLPTTRRTGKSVEVRGWLWASSMSVIYFYTLMLETHSFTDAKAKCFRFLFVRETLTKSTAAVTPMMDFAGGLCLWVFSDVQSYGWLRLFTRSVHSLCMKVWFVHNERKQDYKLKWAEWQTVTLLEFWI